MTATYPNVYLDLSLAIPFAQHGSERVVSTAMELAPTTKLLYGSDGFSVPELYVLAARRFRDALASTLEGPSPMGSSPNRTPRRSPKTCCARTRWGCTISNDQFPFPKGRAAAPRTRAAPPPSNDLLALDELEGSWDHAPAGPYSTSVGSLVPW